MITKQELLFEIHNLMHICRIRTLYLATLFVQVEVKVQLLTYLSNIVILPHMILHISMHQIQPYRFNPLDNLVPSDSD